MLQVATLKSALRAPEGKWASSSERRATINFSPDLPVQLRCGRASLRMRLGNQLPHGMARHEAVQ